MSFRSALENRGFRRLWSAQSISLIGDSIHEIALIWIIYELTGNPILISITVIASFLPTILISLPAGSLVDRWNRKYVLIITEVIRGLAVITIPLVGRGPYLVPTVITVAFITGLMQGFFEPATDALVPNLVPEEDLDSANSLSQMTESVSKIFYALGGGVIAVTGVFTAFYIDAATFGLSAIILIMIPTRVEKTSDSEFEGIKSASKRMMSEVREGIRFVRGHRFLPSILALSMLNGFALAPLAIVIPVFAEKILNSGSLIFSFLYASIYIGIFVGGIIVSVLDERLNTYRGKLIIGGVMSTGMSLVLVGFFPQRLPQTLLFSILMFGLFGLSISVIQVPLNTLAQTVVPDELRGRVFSLWNATALIATPISIAIAGPLVSAVGPTTVLVYEGVLIICCAGVLSLTPLIRVRGTELPEEKTTDHSDNKPDSL